MSSDAPQSTEVLAEETPQTLPPAPATQSQVRFRREGDCLLLILPEETGRDRPESGNGSTWMELWQQLKHRINGGEHAWEPGTDVHLVAKNRLLDGRQLQSIAEALAEVQLELKRVKTGRAQTAVAAATAGYSVDRDSERNHLAQTEADPTSVQAEPLYLKMTLRSGVDIRHPGTVVVLGDVNPGSSIVADGDIIVWGRLRGTVHAGAGGNLQSLVMAVQMEPTLIRIADRVARSPEQSPDQFFPEVAYITANGIRITRANEFGKAKIWQIRG